MKSTEINFTTITGKQPGKRVEAHEHLEAKAERWINNKIQDGWSLRDVLPTGEPTSVHVVMVRKGQA